MVDLNRLDQTIRGVVQADVQRNQPAPTSSPAPEASQQDRLESSIRQAVQSDLQRGAPDMGQRGGIGMLEAREPTFGDAYRAGTDQFRSSIDFTQALIGDIIGDDEMMNSALERAFVRDEISAGLMSGGQTFQELIEDPSLGGGLQFAKETLGQLAPMMLESVAGGIAGGLVGNALAPGVGTVAGSAQGIAARALLRRAVQKRIVDEIKSGPMDAASNRVLSAALRAEAARRGALIGATATELRQGVGEAYRETVEAGDPSPFTSLATAVPFAAIGMLPDRLVIDALSDAARSMDAPTRSALRNLLTQVATQTGAQAAAEAGQEELLIQLHDHLSQDNYAGSSEAMWRRAEAAAAGAIGGSAVGTVSGAAVVATQGTRQLLSGQVEVNEKTLQEQSLEADVEEALRTEGPTTRDMQGEDLILPESQRDIDAQFSSMMDENSPKQAIEVTEGTPLPSGYQPGMEGVFEVQTPNGRLLTTDADIAAIVEQEGGSSESMARALGYASPKSEGMTRAVIARNDDGAIVHSELIADSEPPEAALGRARQFAPNAEIVDATQALQQRADSVRAEGRDPQLEQMRIVLGRTEARMEQLQRSMDILSRARQSSAFVDRWSDISRRIPELRSEIAQVTQQLQEQVRVVSDLEARARERQSIELVNRQNDTLIRQAMTEASADSANITGGIEAVDTNTGEVVSIPREVYNDIANRFRTRNEGENLTMNDGELATRIADEFADRGIQLNITDTRPIDIEQTNREDIVGRTVPESALDPMSAEAHRNPSPNIGAREQIVSRQHRLGPQTEATIVDGTRVPVSAIRQLRNLRQRFPEDNWSLVAWLNDRGQRVFQVKRDRTFAERAGDDRVVRDVDGRDSDAIEMTAQRSFDEDPLSVTPDPAISTTAREQVLGKTAQARWRDTRVAPPESYSLRMIDPDGNEGFYNPAIIANAGMDANQYLIANQSITLAERRQMGVLSALAILKESGYRIYGSTIPNSFYATRARNRRHNVPGWVRVAPDWDILSPSERFDLLNELGIQNIEGVDITDMTELQMADVDASMLPESILDDVRQRKFDLYGAERPEWMQQQPITNRDAAVAGTLSRTGDRVLMDPILHPTLRAIFTQAKEEANIDTSVYVITDQTSRQMIRSLPENVRAAMNTDPGLMPLMSGQQPPRLRGRTVILPSGEAVIWVNSSLRGDKMSLALAHELGHVAFDQHQRDLMADTDRADRLTRAFEAARNRGTVKQYKDTQLGFEEWFADRFAAWVHNRDLVMEDGVARNGKFRQLFGTLKRIANRLRINASRLAEAGNESLYNRIQPDETVNQFLDGISRSAPKQRALNRMRRDNINRIMSRIRGQLITQQTVDRQDMQQIMDEMGVQAELEAEMHAIQAELDAESQELSFRPSVIDRLDDNDSVANAQKDRVENRSTKGTGNVPSYDGDNGDLSMPRNDPNPRIDFDPEADPQAQAADPAPRQDFEPEPEAQAADPAPRQDFEPEPEAGGGGAGQGVPPGGRQPPPGGPGDGGQPPFDPSPMWEAIGGNARRWANTDMFDKVLGWVNENLGPVMQRGYKALRDLTFTDDARLRRLGPIGNRIANWFLDDTFHRNFEGPRGYLNAVEIELGRWMAEVEQILPSNRHEANEALTAAQSSTPTSQLSPQAKRIRRFLRRFYRQYLANNVNGIQMRNDYFPRVYDMSEVMARSDQFIDLLVEAGYSRRESTVIVNGMMEGESTVELSTNDQEGSGPGMSARLQRKLEALDDSRLQDAGFLIEPRAALMQYLRSAVKRVEYERRFAGELTLTEVYNDLTRRRQEGKWVDQEYFNSIQDQYRKTQRPDEVMVQDPSARIKKEIERLPEDQRDEARQIIQNYMGRSNSLFGVQLPPPLARAVSTVGGAMYMATLGLSAISQITDFGAIVLRTRGAEGLGMMHRAIMQLPRDERLAFARAVGSISHQANLDALRMTYGNDFMTPAMRRATDTFFKVIGLEQITNFSRSVATVMGSEFLKTHALKAAAHGDARSARYLQELRVTPQQVFEWQNNGEKFEGESGEAVRQALFQFTDESILRPNAAMRPGWASNPWFTLMWQLKSFAWGFYKVVMRGVANEVVQRRREGAGITDTIAPLVMSGAIMLPLAFSTMVIRDIAKEGLNSVFDDDEYHWNSTRNRSATEWMLELTDRSGMLGPWALVNSAYDAYGWGDNPALTLAGPAAEKIGHLAAGDFSRVTNDMIPVAGLVR